MWDGWDVGFFSYSLLNVGWMGCWIDIFGFDSLSEGIGKGRIGGN